MLSSFWNLNENRYKAVCKLTALLLCLVLLALLAGWNGLWKSGMALSKSDYILTCPYISEGAASIAHTHNESCLDVAGNLSCTLPVIEAHEHTEECYREEESLVCGLEENPGHFHGDECYAERSVLICDQEESIGHVHDENCYVQDTDEFICELEEGSGSHKHTDACFMSEKDLICGKETGEGAHFHDESCRKTELDLICDQDELEYHVHGDDCFTIQTLPKKTQELSTKNDEDEPDELPEKPESDHSADLETAQIWEQAFQDLKLTGDWAQDLIAVAETQFGYTESERNFDAILNDAKDDYILKGWTRYGAWYGYPYGDWCAMFVSFCLHYAGIPEKEYPYDCGTTTWVKALTEGEAYADAAAYTPREGDLIFFDWENDGLADHVGLVYGLDADEDYLLTIEGNHTRTVQTFEYNLSDWRIMGYGLLKPVKLTEQDEPEENEPGEETDVETASGRDKVIIPVGKEEKAEQNLEEIQEEKTEEKPSNPIPAYHFDKTVAGIRVIVDADEEAFPENTYMSLTPLNGNELMGIVSDVIEEEILAFLAVDIAFVNEQCEVIEPAVPVRVSIVIDPTLYPELEATIIHIDHDWNPSVIEQTEDSVTESGREVRFDAENFTPYGMAFTKASTESIQADEPEQSEDDEVTAEKLQSSVEPVAIEAVQPKSDVPTEWNDSVIHMPEENSVDLEVNRQEGGLAAGSAAEDENGFTLEGNAVRAPRTGDESNPAFWTAAAMISAMGMAGSLWLLRRSGRKYS